MNSSFRKANRLSTRKRDSKTNRKGALSAEKPRRLKEEAAAAVLATSPVTITAAVTDGKKRESRKTLFFYAPRDIIH
jgi:hypothetical protein